MVEQQQDERTAAVEAMWPADRAERARLWDSAMARGVAQFWRDAGRPYIAAKVTTERGAA